MFSSAVNVLDYFSQDYMVLAAYIGTFDGGVIDTIGSPLFAKYAGMQLDSSTVNGSGRIVFVSARNKFSILSS